MFIVTTAYGSSHERSCGIWYLGSQSLPSFLRGTLVPWRKQLAFPV